nr:MAG TPA: hypothetical protein [Caudoviricetes sp.]
MFRYLKVHFFSFEKEILVSSKCLFFLSHTNITSSNCQ